MQYPRTLTKGKALFLRSNFRGKTISPLYRNVFYLASLAKVDRTLSRIQEIQKINASSFTNLNTIRSYSTNINEKKIVVNVVLKKNEDINEHKKEAYIEPPPPKHLIEEQFSHRFIAMIFENIKRRITDRDIELLQGCFEIHFSEKDLNAWHVEFKESKMVYSKGRSVFPPDAVFKINKNIFFDLFSGKKSQFLKGKIVIEGNILMGLMFINRFSKKVYTEDYDKPYWYPERH